ncbi:MAG: hypothetical protein H6686_02825 [Fibrobacteria bacterium]|nr:hypothetical protein [Fibrobacteria bacterium]
MNIFPRKGAAILFLATLPIFISGENQRNQFAKEILEKNCLNSNLRWENYFFSENELYSNPKILFALRSAISSEAPTEGLRILDSIEEAENKCIEFHSCNDRDPVRNADLIMARIAFWAISGQLDSIRLNYPKTFATKRSSFAMAHILRMMYPMTKRQYKDSILKALSVIHRIEAGDSIPWHSVDQDFSPEYRYEYVTLFGLHISVGSLLRADGKEAPATKEDILSELIKKNLLIPILYCGEPTPLENCSNRPFPRVTLECPENQIRNTALQRIGDPMYTVTNFAKPLAILEEEN